MVRAPTCSHSAKHSYRHTGTFDWRSAKPRHFSQVPSRCPLRPRDAADTAGVTHAHLNVSLATAVTYTGFHARGVPLIQGVATRRHPTTKEHKMAIRTLTKKINPRIKSELGMTLSNHELASLSQLSTLVTLPEGKRFATEGSIGQEAVVIVEGLASVMRAGEQVAIAGKGDVLGELSLMFNTPRNATLVTETDVTLAVLNRVEFQSLLNLCPRLKQLIEDEAELRSA